MPRSAQQPAAGDVANAMRLLRVLVAALGRSARGIEAQTGITNAQLFVLRQLGADNTLSVTELAEKAHTLQGTMSTVVARLVRAGLIRKARSADDGRRALLSLTAKGRRILARAPAPPTEAVLTSLASLSATEVRCLIDGLQALVDSMDLSVEEAPMLFEDSGPPD